MPLSTHREARRAVQPQDPRTAHDHQRTRLFTKTRTPDAGREVREMRQHERATRAGALERTRPRHRRSAARGACERSTPRHVTPSKATTATWAALLCWCRETRPDTSQREV